MTGVAKALRNRFRGFFLNPNLHRELGQRAGLAVMKSTSAPDISQARHILVVKLDELGDVVLVTGFLTELRRQCPQATITVLVKKQYASLLDVPTHCHRLLIAPDEWENQNATLGFLRDVCRKAREDWREAPPDWALIPRTGPDYSHATYYAFWSGAAHIAAHESLLRDSQPSRTGLCNHVAPEVSGRQEVDCHAAMLRALGLEYSACEPRLFIKEEYRAAASAFLMKSKDRTDGPRIILGIGAGHPSRIWPLSYFEQLAQSLHAHWPDARLIVVGGAQDHAAGETLRSSLPEAIINVAGQLSPLETAALMEQCHLHIGNDSGPAHLAAAAGCGVLVLSSHPQGAPITSPHSPSRFGPRSTRSVVLQPMARSPQCQAGCDMPEPHCIEGIGEGEVFEAAIKMLEMESSQTSRNTAISALTL